MTRVAWLHLAWSCACLSTMPSAALAAGVTDWEDCKLSEIPALCHNGPVEQCLDLIARMKTDGTDFRRLFCTQEAACNRLSLADSCFAVAQEYASGLRVTRSVAKVEELLPKACLVDTPAIEVPAACVEGLETCAKEAEDTARSGSSAKAACVHSYACLKRGVAASCLRLADEYDSGALFAKDAARADALLEQACDGGAGCLRRVAKLREKERALLVSGTASQRQELGRQLFAASLKAAESEPERGCSELASRVKEHHVRPDLDGAAVARLGTCCEGGDKASCEVLQERRALDELQVLCEKGDAAKCVFLAKAAGLPQIRPVDLDLVLRALELACKAGDCTSCHQRFFVPGKLTTALPPPDALGARQIAVCSKECQALKLSDEWGGPAGDLEGRQDPCRFLGDTYLFGLGVKPDRAKAVKAYERSCRREITNCPLFAAALDLAPLSVAERKRLDATRVRACKAFEDEELSGDICVLPLGANSPQLAACEKKSDAEACLSVAESVGARDKRAGQVYYERACRAGSQVGCVKLAELFSELAGEVFANKPHAYELIRDASRACDAGDTAACFAVADARLTEQAHDEALDWDRRDKVREERRAKALAVAEKGCTAGRGSDCVRAAQEASDLARRRELFERGCELKSKEGCRSLAYSYLEPRDATKVVEYLGKACALSEESSCEELSNLGELDEAQEAAGAAALKAACKGGVRAACVPMRNPAP